MCVSAPAQVCPMGPVQTCLPFPSRGRPLLPSHTTQGRGEPVRHDRKTSHRCYMLVNCSYFDWKCSWTPSILSRCISKPEPRHLTKPQSPCSRYGLFFVPRHTVARGVPRHCRLPDEAERQSEPAQTPELHLQLTGFPAGFPWPHLPPLHQARAADLNCHFTDSCFIHSFSYRLLNLDRCSSWSCLCLSRLSLSAAVVRCSKGFPAVMQGNLINHSAVRLSAGAQVHVMHIIQCRRVVALVFYKQFRGLMLLCAAIQS